MTVSVVNRLATLAGTLAPYHTLEVKADGSVYLLRSFQVRSVGELEDACSHYRAGDVATIQRLDGYWLVKLSRPLAQALDSG